MHNLGLSRTIAELNAKLKPELTVLDAIRILVRNGTIVTQRRHTSRKPASGGAGGRQPAPPRSSGRKARLRT